MNTDSSEPWTSILSISNAAISAMSSSRRVDIGSVFTTVPQIGKPLKQFSTAGLGSNRLVMPGAWVMCSVPSVPSPTA